MAFTGRSSRPVGGRMAHQTKIIVKETTKLRDGSTRTGQPYSMYQVVATSTDGRPIDLNLRAFEELPTNEVLDVEVTKFTPQNPEVKPSYTVKRKGGPGIWDSIRDLQERMAKIEARLGFDMGSPDTVAPPPPPPTTAPPEAPAGPPPAVPPAGPPPPPQDVVKDDIPF